jgi:hypothetical protein
VATIRRRRAKNPPLLPKWRAGHAQAAAGGARHEFCGSRQFFEPTRTHACVPPSWEAGDKWACPRREQSWVPRLAVTARPDAPPVRWDARASASVVWRCNLRKSGLLVLRIHWETTVEQSWRTAHTVATHFGGYLVDSASTICLSQRLSHACLSIALYSETANGSLNQLSFI